MNGKSLLVASAVVITIGLPHRSAAQVSNEKAEVFVVITDPPGAVIELVPNARDGADTLGPAPMLVKHVRGGHRGHPRELVITALPVTAGQCRQVRRFSREERAPDTIRFDLMSCEPGFHAPDDWTAVLEEKDVQQKPEVIARGEIEYPDSLRNRGIQGSVELRFVIDTLGQVEKSSLEVLRATHPAFADAAVRTVLGTKYRPGILLDRAVRTRVTVPVSYSVGADTTWNPGPFVKPRTTRTLLR